VSVQLRPFRDEDRPAVVAIHNRVRPDWPMDVERSRHSDAIWDAMRYTRVRLVAEDAAGRIVGFGQIAHSPWSFHPRHFGLRLEVDADVQRQGIGSALHDRLMVELRAHGAHLVRADAPESLGASVSFLTNRGFGEVDRTWDSHLDVARFDIGRFAGAEERVAGQGIEITTLAEQAPDDPTVLAKLYDLFTGAERDEPSLDPSTPLPIDEFVARELRDPTVIPEAFFLARDGERLVGVSSLQHLPPLTDVIDTGFTGVHRDYRGRGIAMALKLRAIRYAREHGYREVRTSNNARNDPMLRINLALGFVRHPPIITFERKIAKQ
jgi:GNAT superfamily N-acetyltransferase